MAGLMVEQWRTQAAAVPVSLGAPGAFMAPPSSSTPPFATSSGPSGAAVSTNEMRASYRGWRYIGIRRLIESCAAVAPCLWVKRGGEPPITDSRFAAFLRQNYGFASPQGAEGLRPVTSHRMLALCSQPNPQDDWAAFIEDYLIQWHVTGKVFLWFLRDKGFGKPGEMWIVPQECIRPKQQTGAVTHWIISSNWYGQDVEVPISDVIFRWQKSPWGKNYSYSTTEAIATWLRADRTIDDARLTSFQNEIKPDVVLRPDPKVYNPQDMPALVQLQERFNARLAGVNKRGGGVYIPPGVEAERVDRPPSEMDYPMSSSQMRDNILAAAGVNKFVAGITEEVNRATAEAARENYAWLALNPELGRVARILTRVAREYDPALVVTFPDQTPLNAEEERAETQLDWTMGAVTPGERRGRRGRPTLNLPGMDVPWIGSGMVPIDQAAEPVEPAPLPGAIPDALDTGEEDEEEIDGEGQDEEEDEADDQDDAEDGDGPPKKKPVKAASPKKAAPKKVATKKAAPKKPAAGGK